MKFSGIYFFVIVTLLVLGCSDNETTDPGDGSDESLLASIVIGRDGGTLEAEGFSLIVPAGAFPSDTELSLHRAQNDNLFTGYSTSGIFEIFGLPSNFTSSLEMRLKLDSSPGGESFVAIGKESWRRHPQHLGMTYRFLEATVSGDDLVSHLQNQQGKSFPQTSHSGFLPTPPPITVQGVTNHQTITSSGGHFKVTGPANLQTEAGQLAAYLEEAFTTIDLFGFDLNRRTWPAQVTILPLADDVGAYINSDKGDNDGYIEYDSGSLADSILVRITAGHEFFHLAQSLYDPRGPEDQAYESSDYFWLDEAVSVWAEEKFTSQTNYVSDSRVGNEDAPFNKLHEGDETKNIDHGYGMSALIAYLVSKPEYGGTNILKSIYERIDQPNWDHPVDAIFYNTSTSTDWWLDFMQQYILGQIYSDITPTWLTSSAILTDTFTIASPADTLETFSDDYSDLSGKLYLIEPSRTNFTSQDKLALDLTGSDDARLIAFSLQGNTIQTLAGPASDLTVDDVQTLAANNTKLLILVAQTRHVHPYETEKTIDLRIRLVSAPVMPTLQHFNACRILIGLNTEKETTWHDINPTGFQLFFVEAGGIQWSGNTFTITETVFSTTTTVRLIIDHLTGQVTEYSMEISRGAKSNLVADRAYTKVLGRHLPYLEYDQYNDRVVYETRGSDACSRIETLTWWEEEDIIGEGVRREEVISHACEANSYVTIELVYWP